MNLVNVDIIILELIIIQFSSLIELKLSDTTINYANNSDGNFNPKINCFCDIPDSSQHAKVRMKTKVMCIIVDSTMYNVDGVRNWFHNNNNITIDNKNTNTISTTRKHLNKGMGVEVATESIATNDSLSLFKNTPGRKNLGV